MANWVNGTVIEAKFWTESLFSLVINAPIKPFIAGQFAKLALEIEENVYNAPTLTSMLPAMIDLNSTLSSSLTGN